MARAHNRAGSGERIALSGSTAELWEALRERMPQCEDELCWLRLTPNLSSAAREDLVENFKPPIPRGADTWLTTTDIDRVMQQYTRIFDNFVWLGAHPVDFQTVSPETVGPAAILRRMKRKRYAALVLNMDPHDQPGSHWVAVLLDKKRRVVEYFDSLADPAPPEIDSLVRGLSEASGKRWKLRTNSVAHQRENNECGVYAIHFLVRRLAGDQFRRVSRDVIRDAEMNAMRPVFFDRYNEQV